MLNVIGIIAYGVGMYAVGVLVTLWRLRQLHPDLYAELKRRVYEEEKA